MEIKISNNIVLVSGGFDPIHSGHIKLIQEAAKYGDVVVLLNSDIWLRNKKGKEFLPFEERKVILNSIKNVIDVISCGNYDRTCIDGIKKTISIYSNKKIFFANGGDRNAASTPSDETLFCEKNHIETIWGIGGDKSNSSSWILKKWSEKN